jgi:hypothetical protein
MKLKWFFTFALKRCSIGVLPPLLLLKTWTTLGTLDATSVVLAKTGQHSIRRFGLQNVTRVGVSIAHATSTNRDILDRVEVLREKTRDSGFSK